MKTITNYNKLTVSQIISKRVALVGLSHHIVNIVIFLLIMFKEDYLFVQAIF